MRKTSLSLIIYDLETLLEIKLQQRGEEYLEERVLEVPWIVGVVGRNVWSDFAMGGRLVPNAPRRRACWVSLGARHRCATQRYRRAVQL